MAEIPLRSYLHEIEKHIESGRNDQAISHSRYLLQILPKCVDAYRLLGKAYLESQRYTDAGDIFQRVLSSVPDDFVSHVGMSIIREDEGNLDEAIWHMEHAFEVQPSNNAIQDELRRLYAKRDNVEPPKIRLTRGALARLYYKGELYQQAVSEIRSAIAENTNRLDLQALLADIYIKINQRVEAADTAIAVLRHLPNCMVAIRVMIQVLAGADREAELKNYRQRLAQLDPYTAFTGPESPTSEEVQDNAVRVEKLDWKPDQVTMDTSTPAWAASLGVDLADLAPSTESTLPDWLDDLSSQPDQEESPEEETSSAFAYGEIVAESTAAAQTAPQQTEEDIPDWLREAGWQPSPGEGMTRELRPDDLDTESLSAEEVEGGIIQHDDQLAQAEIPDWLQVLKPEDVESAVSLSGEPEKPEEDVSPWLDKILPIEPAEASQSQEVIELGPSTEVHAVPDWLKAAGLAAAAVGAAAEDQSEEPVSEEIPQEEILQEITPPEDISPEEMPSEETLFAEFEQTEPESAAKLPFWLDESESLSEKEESLQSEMAQGLPDWVIEPTAEVGEPLEEEKELLFEDEAELSADLPEWLLEPEEPGPASSLPETQVEEIETPEEEIELPEWIFDAGSSDEETAGEQVEAQARGEGEAGGEIPTWLLATQFVSTEESGEEGEPEVDLPDWLVEKEPASMEDLSVFQSEGEPEQYESVLPDWLMESSLETPEPEAAEPQSPDVPGWLLDTESEQPGPEIQEEPTEAAQLGTEYELPSWLAMTEEEIDQPEMDEYGRELPTAPGEAFESIPQEELEVEADRSEAEPEKEENLEEAFAWLMGLGIAAEIARPEEPAEEPDQELTEMEDAPPTTPVGKLKSTEWQVEEGFTALEISEEVEPEPELEEMTPTAESTGEAQAPVLDEDLIDQDAAFAWLESLAVKQGASEALLLTPEERSESMPEWVKRDALAAEAALELHEEPEPSRDQVEQFPISQEYAEVPELIAEQDQEQVFEEELGTGTAFEVVDEQLGEEALFAAEADEIAEPLEAPAEIEKEIEALEEVEQFAEVPEQAEVVETFEEIEEPALEMEPVVEAEIETQLIEEEELPEIPDWLAESEAASREEFDWTPPPFPSRRFDLNEISLSELERIPGIGFISAQNIIAYRDQNGPFQMVEDLTQVPGIGPSTLEGARGFLYVKTMELAEKEPEAAPIESAPQPLLETAAGSPDLALARASLSQGDLQAALEQYIVLIQENRELQPIVQDLQEASHRFAEDPNIWQTLGDAYLRLDQVQEALQAYVKAEQLLR